MTQDASTHARIDAWSRYWQTGALHSCASSFSGNYRGSIAEFWLGVFRELGDRARVLDIATGNAALPQLLLQACTADGVTCDAVDLAPVAPRWIDALPANERQRLRVQGEVAAEALPFADGSFDLVVSQYGIEYASPKAALPEVGRVLRRPGMAAFVVHHAGSRPVTLARDEIQHVDWLLAPDGLLDATAAMLEPMARARTPEGRRSLAGDAAANRARDRFNQLQRALGERAGAAVCPDVLLESRQALAGAIEASAQHGVEAGSIELQRWRIALQDNRSRLADLCRCAMDEASLRDWISMLAAERVAVDTLAESGLLMGWSVRATLMPR